jgi:hypothetical protein
MPNNSSSFALDQQKSYCRSPSKPCILPPGAKPLCYANRNTKDPNRDQFCAYIQNGFLYGAKGCCTPACPSANCPKIRPKPPTGVLPFDVDLSPELVVEQTKTETQTDRTLSFPKLVKLILVLLAMLVVSALLLSL